MWCVHLLCKNTSSSLVQERSNIRARREDMAGELSAVWVIPNATARLDTFGAAAQIHNKQL